MLPCEGVRFETSVTLTGVSFGGAISGEHGIGIDKKEYLPVQMDETLLEIMKNIKKAFDPNNILDPGKIFDS